MTRRMGAITKTCSIDSQYTMIFMRQEEVYLKKHKKEKVALMLTKVQSSVAKNKRQSENGTSTHIFSSTKQKVTRCTKFGSCNNQ